MSSILITGGTGYFGRHFVKEILENNPSYTRICVYSRCEHKQAMMRAGLNDPLNRVRFFIGDIRDLERLKRAMFGVEYVVHAAALKRIETGEYAADELVKTNVIGAMNVIDAAYHGSARKVVCLSTDKSIRPCSPYGYTKALADSLFQSANVMFNPGPVYTSVVYGNIFGSTGSVVPMFRKLAEQGPVPLTDESCTRFTLTVKKAIDIVLGCLSNLSARKIVVRGLPAYRLKDLVDAMGYEYKLTGLPGHEKMHETMGLGETSDKAPRLIVQDLKEMLKTV